MRKEKNEKQKTICKKKIKKIKKYITILLFMCLLVNTYIVSPYITTGIQNASKFIYETESNNITRIVEIFLLTVIFIILLVAEYKKNKKEA